MYRSNETLTDVNSLPYDHQEQSQTESHLNLQLNLALQEKEAATEMLKLSQMTLNNLEEVLDERRKYSSVDYIKEVKAEYSEAIQLLNQKIAGLTKQVTTLQEENHQYKTLNKDLEFDYQQIREKNVELEQELSQRVKMTEEILSKDRTHETITRTFLSIDAVNKEKQDLLAKLNSSEQEISKWSKKCAELEHTGDKMEEALRRSEQRLREYKNKEADHLEVIKNYVRDLNEMKDELQKLNTKLQEQKMESKKSLFELQQEMSERIARLGLDKMAIFNEKTSLQNEVSQLSKTLNQTREYLNHVEISTVDKALFDKLQGELSQVKQQKCVYQNESAVALHEVDYLNNKLKLERQSFDNRLSLTEYQLASLESELQDSRQRCQQLIEENLETSRDIAHFKAQIGFYQKLLEENSLLSTVDKCEQLEAEMQNQVKELDTFVAKYRDQVISWKTEWQKMANHFSRKLEENRTQIENYRSQNEVLREENMLLRQHPP